MTIMTKGKEGQRQSPLDDRWKMTDELREKIKKANIEYKELKTDFENTTFPCPHDGTTTKFVEYVGGYTRVRGLFRCENGHEFYRG